MRSYFYRLATDQIHSPLANILKVFLLLASYGYALGVRVLVFLYRRGLLKTSTLAQPVICVGNITLGGVGKTPLVIKISQYLKSKGILNAVLTRGYMASRKEGLQEGELFSDEAILMQQTLSDIPVLVGANRYALAQSLMERSMVDVFILDDGYQHWKLKKNLNIVAIDATNPFGNGYLVPRGILREPLSHLKRAHVFVITKVDLGAANLDQIKTTLRGIHPQALIVESIHKPGGLVDLNNKEFDKTLSYLMDCPVCFFCSIGNARAFEQTLERQKAKIMGKMEFMDHHRYNEGDIDRIIHTYQQSGAEVLITTEKDLVKIDYYLNRLIKQAHLLCLKIKIELTNNESEFLHRIISLLDR